MRQTRSLPTICQEYKGSSHRHGCSHRLHPPYPPVRRYIAQPVCQSLRPFPQFGTMTDLWGDTGNAAYNSLQISVIQRPWHNLSGLHQLHPRQGTSTTPATTAPSIRVGPQDGNFIQNYAASQDRPRPGTPPTRPTRSTLTWVYSFPIGRGQAFFATNRIMGLIGGGWQLSGIYKYRDGYPLQITDQHGLHDQLRSAAREPACPTTPPASTSKQARINGRWGRGPGANAGNLNQIQYLNSAGF